jgi:hypothetical protein
MRVLMALKSVKRSSKISSKLLLSLSGIILDVQFVNTSNIKKCERPLTSWQRVLGR